MIPTEALIKIGKTESIDKTQLEPLSNFDSINRLASNTWKGELVNINDLNIISIFKGIVIAERELKWLGGSVAGGIWIYKEIQRRNLDNEYQIANWALKNTTNEYIPFGSLNHNKKNVVDYFMMKQEFTYKKEIEKRNREIRLLENKIEGLKNKLQHQENKIEDLKERQRLSRLPVDELLQLIIDDKEKPIYYYRKELERIVNDNLANDNYLSKILTYFKEKEKGDINRLKKKIEARVNNKNL